MKKQEKLEAKVEEARKQAVETIIELFEKKGLYWVREWGNAYGAGSMPRNGVSGRWYAGGNVMHLMASAMSEGYTDPRWFTFNQAKKLGFFPRKGDHATMVEYYKRFKGMKDADGNWTKNEEEADRTFSYMKLVGCFWVFNANQLFDEDGDPMPSDSADEPEPILDGELCAVADRLIETSRCNVHERKGEMRAFYRPGSDFIQLPSREQFTSMEGFITTLTHEMTHSTAPVFGRDMSGHFGSDSYAYEELIAELGSTFVSLELGVHRTVELEGDVNFENHAAYLKSWLSNFRNDTDYLFKAAAQAGKAATFIVDRYNGEGEEKAAA